MQFIMTQQIEHNGVISNIKDNLIQVLIKQQSTCCDCHAKGNCYSADNEQRIIEVESSDPSYKVNDKIIIFGWKSIGLQAVSLAFVLPLVLILFTLILLQSIVANETISGALALSILIPYYFIISFFNDKLKTKFKFELKKATFERTERLSEGSH